MSSRALMALFTTTIYLVDQRFQVLLLLQNLRHKKRRQNQVRATQYRKLTDLLAFIPAPHYSGRDILDLSIQIRINLMAMMMSGRVCEK
jgi:hypothetical protein